MCDDAERTGVRGEKKGEEMSQREDKLIEQKWRNEDRTDERGESKKIEE